MGSDYWYYFQANGKALKNGDNSKVTLKTVNGKKYAFDEEGKISLVNNDGLKDAVWLGFF